MCMTVQEPLFENISSEESIKLHKKKRVNTTICIKYGGGYCMIPKVKKVFLQKILKAITMLHLFGFRHWCSTTITEILKCARIFTSDVDTANN